MTATPLTVSVGTVGFEGARDRTFAKLDAVELQETFRGVPGSKLLARLRSQAPSRFSFVVQVPQVLCQPEGARGAHPSLSYLPRDAPWPTAPFDQGPVGQAAWGWILDVAERLSARALLLQTSIHFRPTASNRRRLSSFLETLPRQDAPRLLWDAQGLWSAEEQQSLCRDLDILPAIDPLLESISPGQAAYLRVLGRSRSVHGLSADDLETLDLARDRLSWGFVMLNTPRSFRDALALKRLGGDGPP